MSIPDFLAYTWFCVLVALLLRYCYFCAQDTAHRNEEMMREMSRRHALLLRIIREEQKECICGLCNPSNGYNDYNDEYPPHDH